MAASRTRSARGGVGIWIDHTQAIFVWLARGPVRITTLSSEAAPRPRSASPAAGESKEQAEARLARRRRQQLREFYLRVIEATADAPRIAVLGPGTAKLELREVIEEFPAAARRLEHVRPCERVAQRQLIERVQELLGAPPGAKPKRGGRGAAGAL